MERTSSYSSPRRKKGKAVTVKIADTEGNYPLGIKAVEIKLMTENRVKTATGSAK